jgi:FkbM family methyltransferase
MTRPHAVWRERMKEHTEQTLKRIARRVGVEVMAYKRSVTCRRRQLLDHLGVDLLVDVGANVGQYAGELRRTGYDRTILSIEPMTSAYAALREAAKGDRQWEVLHAAAGAEAGVLTLNISDDHVYSSALPIADRAVHANARSAYRRTEQVPVRTLDDVLSGRTCNALGVKVDVQGFESHVLDGAPQTLARAAYLELELSPRPIYDGQVLMNDILQRVDDLGFTLVLTENVFPDFKSGVSMQFNGVFARV